MNWKRLISSIILLLSFASSSAHAWWFFFIPGRVTGEIADAFTGSEGANCVGSTARVGDRVRVPDGSVGIIKSLSGTSIRCADSRFPIRALIESSDDSTPSYIVSALEKPSSVSMPSGLIGASSAAGIELSDGWVPEKLTATLKEKGYFLYAKNKAIDAGLLLSASRREGIADTLEFVNIRRNYQELALIGGRATELEQLEVHGMPAWRFEVIGKDAVDAVSKTYLVTIVAGQNDIAEVKVWCDTGSYFVRKTELSKLAYGLQGLSEQQAPAPSVTPTTTSDAPVAATTGASMTTSADKTTKVQSSIAARLTILNKLYKDGLITEKDFDSKKQEILRGL